MQEIWYDIVLYDYQTNQDRTARLYHHDQVCECWRKSLWSNVYKYSLISRFNSSLLISFDFSFYFNSNLRLQKQTTLLLLLLLLLLFFQLSKCNSQESSSSSSRPSSPLSQSPALTAHRREAHRREAPPPPPLPLPHALAARAKHAAMTFLLLITRAWEHSRVLVSSAFSLETSLGALVCSYFILVLP